MEARSRQGARPLRLLQFTDLHLRDSPAGRVRGVATAATFARCLAHAAGALPPADALLLTGDLVQDDAGGYRLLAAALASSPVPVLCLPGNHDLSRDMAASLPAPPFDRSPALRFGAWTILQLDSTVAGATHGKLGRNGLERLAILLAEHADSHVLICLHHQPVPIGSVWLDAVGLRDGAALVDLARQSGAVRGILWGHVHQAFDEERDGLRLMGTPSTCFQFSPGLAGFAIDKRPPGYRWLELHADGQIDTRIVWLPVAQDLA